jgi:hypothetical protein
MNKYIMIFTAIVILHLNGFSQMFDATIDGGLPGTEKDVVSHFEKKGYFVVKDVAYPKYLVFMIGTLKSDEQDGKRHSVLLHLTKEEDTDFVKSIAVYFTPDSKSAFEQHKKRFAEKCGEPTTVYNKRSVWLLNDYKYTIGVDENGVYHEVKLNKTL